MRSRLALDILSQPDDSTCGPTCLQAVYAYHGLPLPLERVIAEVPQFDEGGTLAVMLGVDALRRGFDARIHTCNLQVFDPTWFGDDPYPLAERLRMQAEAKTGEKLRAAIAAYLELLELGGTIELGAPTPELLHGYLREGVPILTGLSATWLYGTPRELVVGDKLVYDDVRGVPQGHFVLLVGHDAQRGSVLVADPLRPNPVAAERSVYEVAADRLIASILLGVLTYDANLLVVRARGGDAPETCPS